MIVIGSAKVDTAGRVTITRPSQGLGTFKGVRLTNYTPSIILIESLDQSAAGSVEYLLPLQQNVYPTNIRGNMATLRDVSLGTSLNVRGFLVEWSDDPGSDFGKRQYPTTVSTGGNGSSSGTVSTLALPTNGVPVLYPANAFRSRLQWFNNSGSNVKWSTSNGGWNAAPVVATGKDRTFYATSDLWFQPQADGLYVEVIEEYVTPLNITPST